MISLSNAEMKAICKLQTAPNAQLFIWLDPFPTYRFVHSYSDGSLGDIEYDTSATVVMLERHTLVDGWIHFNIDIITSL